VNKLVLISGCLVFLSPLTASAAQEMLLSSAFLGLIVGLSALIAVGSAAVCLSQLRGLRRRKRELEAERELQKELIAGAPFPIIQINQHLKIIGANRVAQDRFGPESLVGGSFPELCPGESAHPLLQVLKSGTPPKKAIHPSAGMEGATFRLYSSAGQRFGFWYGPPEEEQCLQSSSAFIAQAEESANRMKSEFIANINHEVRTPMNAIIGYTEMLVNSSIGDKERRFVETIHKSSMALVTIFNDIMELSKIDSGRLQILTSSIRIDSLVREVEGLYRDQAREKDIRLEYQIEPHLPISFVLDGVRIKQVLHNLVSNAIKFTSEGSVQLLVDGVASKEHENCYDLSFTVQDTGIGIAKTDQQKIFEVFSQQEDTMAKRYGGIGLGLTLCSRLVTMMGGRIELFSTPGEGARFTVLFPQIPTADPPKEQPEIEMEPDQSPASRAMTLLVVDDVDLIKDVFIDFFQDGPHKVITANTGDEALQQAHQEHPDLIFMDLNLSGDMDGRMVTERIREDDSIKATPVIVMTGEMLDEEDYLPLFDGFLQKPFRLDLLNEVIDQFAAMRKQPQKQQGLTDEQDEATLEVTIATSVQAVWNEELDQLFRQAVRSGSLTDAAALGAAVGKAGEMNKDGLLRTFGGDLLQFAAEPNIMGVDRMLAKLSRIVNRKNA